MKKMGKMGMCFWFWRNKWSSFSLHKTSTFGYFFYPETSWKFLKILNCFRWSKQFWGKEIMVQCRRIFCFVFLSGMVSPQNWKYRIFVWKRFSSTKNVNQDFFLFGKTLLELMCEKSDNKKCPKMWIMIFPFFRCHKFYRIFVSFSDTETLLDIS